MGTGKGHNVRVVQMHFLFRHLVFAWHMLNPKEGFYGTELKGSMVLWSYGTENFGSKDQFPKICSDFRQGSMPTGVRGENLKLKQPICVCVSNTTTESSLLHRLKL